MTKELFTIVNVLVQGQAVSAEANVCPMGHKISNERAACELGKARMTTVRKPAGFGKTAILSLPATVNACRLANRLADHEAKQNGHYSGHLL